MTIINLGPLSAPAQSLLHAIAEKRIASPATAWHGCLAFFSVPMRLPPEDRLAPADAGRLLEEIFARMSVHDLPAGERASMPQTAARDAITGGGFTLPTSPRSLVRLAPRLWSRTTGGSSYWRCATTCVSRPRPNISIP